MDGTASNREGCRLGGPQTREEPQVRDTFATRGTARHPLQANEPRANHSPNMTGAVAVADAGVAGTYERYLICQ